MVLANKFIIEKQYTVKMLVQISEKNNGLFTGAWKKNILGQFKVKQYLSLGQN